jgi:hypothetical protein
MDTQMRDIMQRRADLIKKIAFQREQVVEAGLRLRLPFAFADGAWVAVKYVRTHPLIVLGVTVLIAVRRGGMAGAAGGAWRLWRLYKLAKASLTKMTSSL